MTQEIIHQIAVTGPGLEETYILPEGQTDVGRHEANQLALIHPLVSRRHARLIVKGGECAVLDLGSTHGTLVNRARLEPETPRLLQSGDVVEIGAFRLIYERLALGEPEITGETPPAETPAEPPPPDIPPPPAVRPPPLPIPQISRAWETARYVPVFSEQPAANGRKQPAGEPFTPPPGLSRDYSNYLQYLPDIYHLGRNNFITRFLALLESILAPVEWTVDNFDLFLDPKTAPADFLPWLANWFLLTFDETWSEPARRQILSEAQEIFPRRGTAWALRRILEIYTGAAVEIDDQSENLEPFTFAVTIAASEQDVNRNVVEQIINRNKPAHTSYALVFRQ